LMYFLRGSLPWQGLKVDKNEDRYKKIYEKKKNTTPEDLCKGYAPEFCQYVHYTRNLSFEQEPDYNYLRGLLKKVLVDSNFNPEVIMFDWEKRRGSVSTDSKSVSKNVMNTTTNHVSQNDTSLINTSQINNNITNTNDKDKQKDKKNNSNNNIQLPNINQYKPHMNGGNNNNVLKKKDTLMNDIQPTKSVAKSNDRVDTDANKSRVNTSIINNVNNVSQYVETNQNNVSHIIMDKNSRNVLQTQLNTQMNTNNISQIQYTKEDVKKQNVSMNHSVFNQNNKGFNSSYVKSPIKSEYKATESNVVPTLNNKSKSPTPNLKPKNESKCIVI